MFEGKGQLSYSGRFVMRLLIAGDILGALTAFLWPHETDITRGLAFVAGLVFVAAALMAGSALLSSRYRDTSQHYGRSFASAAIAFFFGALLTLAVTFSSGFAAGA